MDEQTLTQLNSYTALNRAALLRPAKEDELLASILKDSTVEVESNKARARVQYTDEVSGQTYGSILIAPNIEQIYTEEAMIRVVAPQLWTRVMMGRVSFYAKQVR